MDRGTLKLLLDKLLKGVEPALMVKVLSGEGRLEVHYEGKWYRWKNGMFQDVESGGMIDISVRRIDKFRVVETTDVDVGEVNEMAKTIKSLQEDIVVWSTLKGSLIEASEKIGGEPQDEVEAFSHILDGIQELLDFKIKLDPVATELTLSPLDTLDVLLHVRETVKDDKTEESYNVADESDTAGGSSENDIGSDGDGDDMESGEINEDINDVDDETEDNEEVEKA